MHSYIGNPFKVQYWLAQTAVYLAVMLLEKLMVGPLVAFPFWSKVRLLHSLVQRHDGALVTGGESDSTLE